MRQKSRLNNAELDEFNRWYDALIKQASPELQEILETQRDGLRKVVENLNQLYATWPMNLFRYEEDPIITITRPQIPKETDDSARRRDSWE